MNNFGSIEGNTMVDDSKRRIFGVLLDVLRAHPETSASAPQPGGAPSPIAADLIEKFSADKGMQCMARMSNADYLRRSEVSGRDNLPRAFFKNQEGVVVCVSDGGASVAANEDFVVKFGDGEPAGIWDGSSASLVSLLNTTAGMVSHNLAARSAVLKSLDLLAAQPPELGDHPLSKLQEVIALDDAGRPLFFNGRTVVPGPASKEEAEGEIDNAASFAEGMKAALDATPGVESWDAINKEVDGWRNERVEWLGQVAGAYQDNLPGQRHSKHGPKWS